MAVVAEDGRTGAEAWVRAFWRRRLYPYRIWAVDLEAFARLAASFRSRFLDIPAGKHGPTRGERAERARR